MFKRNPKQDGFSVAFIDVMACGLGAVVLLLVILDYRSGVTLTKEVLSPPPGVLETEDYTARMEELEKELSSLSSSIASLVLEKVELKSELAVLSRPPQATVASQKVVEDKNGNLVGVRVSGRRSLILLDTSASMVSSSLSEIMIYTAGGNSNFGKNKWFRSLAVVDWLLAQYDSGATVTIIGFDETAKVLASDLASSVIEQWPTIKQDLTPANGTSLDEVSKLVGSQFASYDTIYMITDGLPTKGSKGIKNLLNLPSCGVSRGGFVSGACRLAFFEDAYKKLTSLSSQINVILLPLEGDPKAAPAFWQLTSVTGGTFLVPARGWPKP